MGKLTYILLLLVACQSESKLHPWSACHAFIDATIRQLDASPTRGSIYAFQDEGKTYLSVDPCGQDCADGMATVYDCSGNPVCWYGGITGGTNCVGFENASEWVLVWKK